MIRVLVADDSPTVREYLAHIINESPDMTVVGTAHDGKEALELARREKPDVLTMDINMPRMNGLEATRRIMEETPAPIIIVTASWDTRDVQTTFMAIEAGALAVLEKPSGPDGKDHEREVKELIDTIRLMSEVKVVRRISSAASGALSPARPQVSPAGVEVVAIGASTGGPMTIRTVLSGLPEFFSAPIVIVQHMTAGFVQGFADWLDNYSSLTVSIASDGQHLRAGHVYVAPEGFQLGIDTQRRTVLSDGAPENNSRPSVSYLFRSVAAVCGGRAVGVLLTGMGKDGARELKMMREQGAITIAQDRQSSVVYGMPGEAAALGAAQYILSPEEIVNTLVRITRKRKEG